MTNIINRLSKLEKMVEDLSKRKNIRTQVYIVRDNKEPVFLYDYPDNLPRKLYLKVSDSPAYGGEKETTGFLPPDSYLNKDSLINS